MPVPSKPLSLQTIEVRYTSSLTEHGSARSWAAPHLGRLEYATARVEGEITPSGRFWQRFKPSPAYPVVAAGRQVWVSLSGDEILAPSALRELSAKFGAWTHEPHSHTPTFSWEGETENLFQSFIFFSSSQSLALRNYLSVISHGKKRETYIL